MPEEPETYTESMVLTVGAGLTGFTEVVWARSGKLREIVLHFPVGANATTGVWFTVEGVQVFPMKDGTTIALDGATERYPVKVPIMRGDRVRLNGTNTDSVSHTIRAQLTLDIEQKTVPSLLPPPVPDDEVVVQLDEDDPLLKILRQRQALQRRQAHS